MDQRGFFLLSPFLCIFRFFSKKKKIIYLAVLGLSCGTLNLHSGMQTSLLWWCTGLAILCMWDLSSQTRDRTHILCSRRQIPNYWTTREIKLFNQKIKCFLLCQLRVFSGICNVGSFKIIDVTPHRVRNPLETSLQDYMCHFLPFLFSLPRELWVV